MRLQFAGAAQTVTGSQTVVTHRAESVLVDCGLFQGPKDLRLLNWEKPSYFHEIKAMIITHAHVDHCGLLPRWALWGWKGPIYCTQATADLLSIMLLDAARLQEEDAKFANMTKHSHHAPALPLYTEKDALKILEYVEPLPFDKWFDATSSMSFRFLRSGHILGSAIVQISYIAEESKILTFSGDLGGGHSDLIKEPVVLSETHDLVLETTYGDRKINFENREERLAEVINKVVLRGGTLVIPSFALGRSQDILYSIHKLNSEKRIPNVPVYLDSPMANAITKVYLQNLEELKFNLVNNHIEESLSPSFFHKVESPDDSMLLCMSNEPKIVLSASGMLQGGRVLHHLKHILPDEKNGVLFVGFQGAGTKGRLLQQGIPNLRIHHQEIPVDAGVFTVDGYSAHADAEDILMWVDAITKKPKRIFLNHGENNSIQAFSRKITSKLNEIELFVPKMYETFNL